MMRSLSITSNLLKVLLALNLGVILGYLMNLAVLFLPYLQMSFSNLFSGLSFAISIPAIMLVFYWPYWVFKLHQDLKAKIPAYPISPGGALMMTVMPVYNIWGSWKMTGVVYKVFKEKGLDLKLFSLPLDKVFFLLLFFTLLKMFFSHYLFLEFPIWVLFLFFSFHFFGPFCDVFFMA